MRYISQPFLLAVLAIMAFAAEAFVSPISSMLIGTTTALKFVVSDFRNKPMTLSSVTTRSSLAAMPASEQERLLLTEPAQTAFITAEMRSFLSLALKRNDGPSGHLSRWELSSNDKIAAGLADSEGNVTDEEYLEAKRSMAADADGGDDAINLLCDATSRTFQDGFSNQPGLLSSLGSAICYFRDAFRTPVHFAACERVGLSDYDVAHHITDMYHHRNFRGAYTKTLTPSGSGEIAARAAVGLDAEVSKRSDNSGKEGDIMDAMVDGMTGEDDGDECVLWSPTTSGVCIHWKSDDEAWRKKRFERIQMEGTKDPRRGGSGGTR